MTVCVSVIHKAVVSGAVRVFADWTEDFPETRRTKVREMESRRTEGRSLQEVTLVDSGHVTSSVSSNPGRRNLGEEF